MQNQINKKRKELIKMFFTCIVRKRVIVEADSLEEAEEMYHNEDSIVEEESLERIRKMTNSEKIYFGLYDE